MNAQSRGGGFPGAGEAAFLGLGRQRQAGQKTFHWVFLRWRNYRQVWGGSDHKLLAEHPRAGNNAFTLEQRGGRNPCAPRCWGHPLLTAGDVLHYRTGLTTDPVGTSSYFRLCKSPIICAKVMKVKKNAPFILFCSFLEMIFGGTERTWTV